MNDSGGGPMCPPFLFQDKSRYLYVEAFFVSGVRSPGCVVSDPLYRPRTPDPGPQTPDPRFQKCVVGHTFSY